MYETKNKNRQKMAACDSAPSTTRYTTGAESAEPPPATVRPLGGR